MKARLFLPLLLATLLGFAVSAAHAAEKRIALVIGESAYGKPLPTTANDAGLIAQTLQAAGFDVAGARDLDEEGLRAALRDFVDKASQAGPDAAAFVYFAGLGLQLEGENYLVPVNATIARDSDIALHALRLSDYLKPLSALGLKAAVVVLDAARENPFALAGKPIAGGLALYEPGPAALLAFNTAPGAIAKDGTGPYGPYAQALAEMIRAGGMSLNQLFEETRLRVGETTKGAQIPWNSAAINSPFLFFERTAGAPPRPDLDAGLRDQPLQQLGPEGAFAVVVQKDTIHGYQDFLAIYPDDPLAKRVRALLAARREALYWQRARTLDTPEAYWSYARRYPHGPHAADCERMLALRAAAFAPPPSFIPVDFGYPPPPPDEYVYVDRPVLYFDDPAYGFAPPPPPPVYLLPPPPPDFVALPPPYVVADAYVLPVPVFIPAPAYIRTPDYIAPPPNNLIFENLHNTVAVDHATSNVVVSSPQGQALSSHALATVGAVGAAAAIGVALPHVLKKVVAPPAPAQGAVPGHGPLPAPAALPTNHALPMAPPPTSPKNGLSPVVLPHAGAPTPTAMPAPPGTHAPSPPAAAHAPSPAPAHLLHAPPPAAAHAPHPAPAQFFRAPPPAAAAAPHPAPAQFFHAPPPAAAAAPHPAPAQFFHAPPPAPRPAAPPAKHCVKENGKDVCR
jgi:uncharacterized caspase-like protein